MSVFRTLSLVRNCSLKLLVVLAAMSSQAQVVSKNNHGFNLKITAEVAVSAKVAYEQFINVGEWWVADHTYFGDSAGLAIDARAGGCFCEIDGNKEVLHMLVTQVRPGEEIRMVGGLGPLQMMGVHGGMSWRFERIDDERTRIIQTYNVTGYMDGGLDQLAEIVDAVQSGQLQSLVSRLTVGAK
jgi:hypothetical protein